jgi:hypothetical protein
MTVDSPANQLLATGFDETDVIAIAFRRLPDGHWHHRFLSVQAARQPRFQSWLRYLNAHGSDLYFSVNAFNPGVRARTEANVAAVRHLYVEFDAGGDAALAQVRATPGLPPPSYVVHSSPGRFQLLWNVEGFTREVAKPLLRYLAYSLQADRAVHDLNRVLRLPGFANFKYRPPAFVTLEAADCLDRYHPGQFPVPTSSPPPVERAERVTPPDGWRSQSEIDWRLVCLALSRGASWRACVDHLAANRRDKTNPHLYAARTVLKAADRVLGSQPPDLVAELDRLRGFRTSSR